MARLQALAEEQFATSLNWLLLRLSMQLLLIMIAVLVLFLTQWDFLTLPIIPLAGLMLGLAGRDLLRYNRQRVTLQFFDAAIQDGFVLSNHRLLSLFDAQFSRKRSDLGHWLGYGDLIIRQGNQQYHLVGIHNVDGLLRSISLRRSIVLRSLHPLPQLSLPRLGMAPQLQPDASVLSALAQQSSGRAYCGETLVMRP
ncbi:MAG: hypothetical protein HC822_12260 [Oscillochloris sp.]|nr:hypothetical protein [Oscillochloris sp.]